MPIAFHGTPIVPVTRNGRAARTVCDSTTRLSEDKANPISALTWYPEVRANPCQFSVMSDSINMRDCTLLGFYSQIGFKIYIKDCKQSPNIPQCARLCA
jgi:hypothetical protein